MCVCVCGGGGGGGEGDEYNLIKCAFFVFLLNYKVNKRILIFRVVKKEKNKDRFFLKSISLFILFTLLKSFYSSSSHLDMPLFGKITRCFKECRTLFSL